MPTRLVWSEGAIDDLAQVYEFIARDSSRYAEVVVRALIGAPARLTEFPRSGRIVPELQREDVREVLWKTYRIVYQLGGEEAVVLTVFRASRLFPPLHLEGEAAG